MTFKNPVRYFEIPVIDLDRAQKFYSAVFGFDFAVDVIDGYQMALFPYTEGVPGVTGALVKGDVYVPSVEGSILYFHAKDIDETLALAVKAGGKILYPKKSIGNLGYVAEFQDSEGNRIALHQDRIP